MKKLITICILAAMVSVAYALPSDDFNDNSMNTSMWNLFQESPSVWLNETNGRLEVRSTADMNGSGPAYFAYGWGLSTANNFSFKAASHVSSISVPGDYEFGTGLGLGKGGGDLAMLYNNNASINATKSVNEYDNVARFNCDKNTDGIHFEGGEKTRSQDNGTLYISYDASKDELYLSDTDYWAANAWVTLPGLLKGEWDSTVVIPFLGASYVRNIALASGDVHLDNFVVDSGTIVPICEYALAGDLNDDCKVDFEDFAAMSSYWLIDCTAEPGNPACVSK